MALGTVFAILNACILAVLLYGNYMIFEVATPRHALAAHPRPTAANHRRTIASLSCPQEYLEVAMWAFLVSQVPAPQSRATTATTLKSTP